MGMFIRAWRRDRTWISSGVVLMVVAGAIMFAAFFVNRSAPGSAEWLIWLGLAVVIVGTVFFIQADRLEQHSKSGAQ